MGGNVSANHSPTHQKIAARGERKSDPNLQLKRGDLQEQLSENSSPYRERKGTAIHSPTFQKLLKLGRMKGVGSGKSKDSDDEGPSPLEIRHGRLHEMEAQRPTLSSEQIELIRTTWDLLQKNISHLGSNAFVKLFETYPDMKGAFGPFRSMKAEDQQYSNELRAHGERVFKTVDSVLKKIDSSDQMIAHLHDLGNKHVTFNAKPEYMDIVSQMFLFAIEAELKDSWNPKVEQAWADLFRLIIHVMRESMML